VRTVAPAYPAMYGVLLDTTASVVYATKCNGAPSSPNLGLQLEFHQCSARRPADAVTAGQGCINYSHALEEDARTTSS
jgi:hypothetical protein